MPEYKQYVDFQPEFHTVKTRDTPVGIVHVSMWVMSGCNLFSCLPDHDSQSRCLSYHLTVGMHIRYYYTPASANRVVGLHLVSSVQWSNYGGARWGLAHLKDLAAPVKHLF